MILVVDFNIIFSFFKKFSSTRKLFFNKNLELFSPEFSLQELSKYRKLVMLKSHIDLGKFGILEKVLSWSVEFIPTKDFKIFLEKAGSISPDPDDIEYFALALKYNCHIWSEDKLLKKQDKVKVLSTSELLKEL